MWERENVVGLRWIRCEGDELVRFLILFKGGGRRVSQRFHFSYVSQGNKEEQDWFEIFCMAPSLFHMKITVRVKKS